MKIHLETPRFYLREFDSSDADGLFALDSDPDVLKYLGVQPLTSINQVYPMIEAVQKQYAENGTGRWIVVDKDSEEFLGWCGLKHEKQFREFPYYDIGYRFLKKHWGKGIASETAQACLDYGLTVLKYPEINATAEVEHAASNHILQKIGLELKDQFDYQGIKHNWYSILNK